jgi:predicted DNA-binding protein
MSKNVPITLRLAPEVVEQMKVVANLQDRTMNDVLRDAICGYLDEVSGAPEFQSQLDDTIERMRSLFADRNQTR